MLQYRLKVNIQYTLRTRIPFKDMSWHALGAGPYESDVFFFFFAGHARLSLFQKDGHVFLTIVDSSLFFSLSKHVRFHSRRFSRCKGYALYIYIFFSFSLKAKRKPETFTF